ncbi:ParA family protein [Pseudomonas aeruginosa]|uniref:ParA family protein n=1 Tax=Pseudomonas aeruginosa TaxID=287 RepID=UPI001067A7F7|nr:ParA family protein [Pseudomonas aeruginosa]TEK21352.1 ParA family protein [Pseudomonas aeruginosa]
MNAKATSVVSTKGGVGKSTTAANLGAFCADAGLKTLLIDLDPVQPSLSSYYELPDGRLRLANLMPSLKQGYDLVLIDTQGARSALLEMVVLASDLVVSPLQPNMLTAREFNRGTMQMLDGLRPYERLGMRIPKVQIVINCLDQTNDSRAIHENVRAIFDEHQDISVLETTVPDAVVFRNAASRGLPAHRLETRQPSNRTSAPALEIIRNLAIEVFPEWTDRFLALTPEAVAALVKGGR